MIKNICNINLNNFQGPLELLLLAVKEKKINILELDLLLLINQYIEFLDKNIDYDFDTLSNYLVISSYLLEVKSRLLIPEEKDNFIEDEKKEEFNEYEMKKQMLECKKFKDISLQFQERKKNAERLLSKKYSKLDNNEEVDYKFDLGLLTSAFSKIAIDFKKSSIKHVSIKREEFELEVLEQLILNKLINVLNKKTLLINLVKLIGTTIECLIATFLALLNLAKNNKVFLLQENNEIFIELI